MAVIRDERESEQCSVGSRDLKKNNFKKTPPSVETHRLDIAGRQQQSLYLFISYCLLSVSKNRVRKNDERKRLSRDDVAKYPARGENTRFDITCTQCVVYGKISKKTTLLQSCSSKRLQLMISTREPSTLWVSGRTRCYCYCFGRVRVALTTVV